MGKDISNVIDKALYICIYIYLLHINKKKHIVFKGAKDKNVRRNTNGLNM